MVGNRTPRVDHQNWKKRYIFSALSFATQKQPRTALLNETSHHAAYIAQHRAREAERHERGGWLSLLEKIESPA